MSVLHSSFWQVVANLGTPKTIAKDHIFSRAALRRWLSRHYTQYLDFGFWMQHRPLSAESQRDGKRLIPSLSVPVHPDQPTRRRGPYPLSADIARWIPMPPGHGPDPSAPLFNLSQRLITREFVRGRILAAGPQRNLYNLGLVASIIPIYASLERSSRASRRNASITLERLPSTPHHYSDSTSPPTLASAFSATGALLIPSIVVRVRSGTIMYRVHHGICSHFVSALFARSIACLCAHPHCIEPQVYPHGPRPRQALRSISSESYSGLDALGHGAPSSSEQDRAHGSNCIVIGSWSEERVPFALRSAAASPTHRPTTLPGDME
ncbi:hypothetical protein DFH07DRAFT_958229 [Mycena maculata]|uniref:Uncharacterized protein n=1 Tax=Mycena maculata TaxID=230809 RepID=A0AAD7J845_9AGAR|nr:hypothetical protein DFH07DRAFT_958229 [Mycena maculata]